MASQLPLVVAFVYFSLKIVNIYQGAQSKLIDQHQEQVRVNAERQAKMIETITRQWIEACDTRDKDMRTFLQEISTQQRQAEMKLLEVLKDNTNALTSLHMLISALQIQVATAQGNNPPTRPIPSRRKPATPSEE